MAPDSGVPIALAHRIGLPVVSLILVAIVLELVRRGHLKERYALLWLATSAFGLAVGIFPQIIVTLSHWLRFQYLTVLFVLSFVFILGLVLAFSVIISTLNERNRMLTQEVALLANQVARLENKIDHESGTQK